MLPVPAGHKGTVLAVWLMRHSGENTMETGQVSSGLRHQGSKPRHKIQWLEDNVGSARPKALAFDPLQQIGQYFIDYLSAQESCERKHALAPQIIDALAHQLLPRNAFELVQGIAVEIN